MFWETSLRDRDVLVVEDIIDTGYTMEYLRGVVAGHSPKSVKVCALVNKTGRRKVEVNLDYCGFELEGGFLVGYGLDYDERYRCLPDIYRLTGGGKEEG